MIVKRIGIFIFLMLVLSNSFIKAQSWLQRNPLPEGMAPVTTRIEDKIYVLNTTPKLNRAGSLYEYDIKQNSWKEKTRVSNIRYNFSAVSLNGKIYAFGGSVDTLETPTAIVEEYNPASDKWIDKNSMPTARYLMSACTYEGKIYVFGGYTAKDVESDILEVYDPVTNRWEKKSHMPSKGTFNQVNIIGRQMYLMRSNGLNRYNPETDQWSTTSTHGHANCPVVRVAMVNDEIYAIINLLENWKGITSYLDKYNPVTDTWTNLKSLPYHKMDFSFVPLGNKLYVLGGWKDDYQKAVNTCEMYNIETNEWKIIPNMTVPRVETGVEIINNSLFVFGGFDGYKYDSKNRLDNNRVTYFANVESLTDQSFY